MYFKIPKARRKNKFNSISCRCDSGHWHMSRFEAGYCNKLRYLVKAGEVLEYKTQVKYSFDIAGVHICSYYADFVVTNKNGLVTVHETKGYKTDVYNIKKRLFAVCYPDIPFVEIRA